MNPFFTSSVNFPRARELHTRAAREQKLRRRVIFLRVRCRLHQGRLPSALAIGAMTALFILASGDDARAAEAELIRAADGGKTSSQLHGKFEPPSVAEGGHSDRSGDASFVQRAGRTVENQSRGTAQGMNSPVEKSYDQLEVGVRARETARGQLLDDVAKGWLRPGPILERAPVISAGHSDSTLAKKLNEIILPNVSFTRAEIGAVVTALSALSEQFDPAVLGPRGVNIVLLDPANRVPAVTVMLRNASLKRVLDFVTEATGYQYEVQADAVVIRPGPDKSALETAFFPVSRATVLRMSGGAHGGGKTEGGVEKAAAPSEAGAMRTFLQQAGVSFLAEGASLAYDGSAIIVTQTAANLGRIRTILTRYREVRQVEIETKFMEVQEGALEELGVKWNITRRGLAQVNPTTGEPVLDAYGRRVFTPQETYSTSGVTRSLAGAFPNSSNGNSLTISSTPDSGGPNLTVPVAPATIPGGVALAAAAGALADITAVVGDMDVSALVRALSQKQGSDLLSSPKVTVLSGSSATITVAQEMRYPQSYGEIQSQVGSSTGTGSGGAGVTITAGTPQEFTSRNVGVEMKVTPTVEDDDYSISLDLNPKVTEFEGFVEYGGPSVAISSGTTVTVPPGFFQPIFSVREITTKVTLWDGATLVMGGLTREEVKKVHDKVPILGDIPLLGRLFRSKGESSQKRNLLIFVTANLVNPGGAPRRPNVGRGSELGDREVAKKLPQGATESSARLRSLEAE